MKNETDHHSEETRAGTSWTAIALIGALALYFPPFFFFDRANLSKDEEEEQGAEKEEEEPSRERLGKLPASRGTWWLLLAALQTQSPAVV